jgi:hypothetical protein
VPGITALLEKAITLVETARLRAARPGPESGHRPRGNGSQARVRGICSPRRPAGGIGLETASRYWRRSPMR